jgi:hypothetical protein
MKAPKQTPVVASPEIASPVISSPEAEIEKKRIREALDRINILVLQLQGMCAVTFGDCGQSFRDLNDEIQDCFMWALSDKVDDLRAVVERFTYPDMKVAA